AVQFLSINDVTEEFLTTSPMFDQLTYIRSDLEIALAGKLENHFHRCRVNFIHVFCLTSVEYTRNSDIPLSDKLDKIFTHKFFGIPIFLCIMFLIFQITFTYVFSPLSYFLYGFIFFSLTDCVTSFLTTIGAS
ncbi:ferrous iron transporter B, partial [Listeria monocytogenes]